MPGRSSRISLHFGKTRNRFEKTWGWDSYALVPLPYQPGFLSGLLKNHFHEGVDAADTELVPSSKASGTVRLLHGGVRGARDQRGSA